MAALITPIVRFTVSLIVTVVWALILSKLIRSAWSLISKHIDWRPNQVVITK